jgi:hypothetical protein
MNLILLPGNSKRNKTWLETVDTRLQKYFKNTYRQNYSHWDKGEPEIDLSFELKKLNKNTPNLRPYAIFAKSVGTLLALKAIYENKILPSWCLFAGMPLELVKNENIDLEKWFNATTCPIYIIQNDSDPVGNYNDVRRFLNDIDRPDINVIEAPGSTHNYDDIDFLEKLVQELLNI